MGDAHSGYRGQVASGAFASMLTGLVWASPANEGSVFGAPAGVHALYFYFYILWETA